jgi:hypothetical protein
VGYAIISSGARGRATPPARGAVCLKETARGRRDVRVVTPIVLEHYRFY